MKKISYRMNGLCALLCAMLAPLASADVLVKYDFSDITAPTTPTEVADGLESESLAFSGAFADAYEAYKADSTHEFLYGGDMRIVSSKMPEGTQINASDYVEIKLKAKQNETIQVTNVEITGSRSDNIPALYVYPKFTTSADGHTEIFGLGQIKSKTSKTMNKEVSAKSSEGELTIRLHFPVLNPGSKNRVIIDDITVLGSVLAK